MLQTQTKISLTKDQQDSINFMMDKKNPISLLLGSAGVGKTVTVSEFANQYRNVICAAPTHKAVQVLATKTNAECCTIHSLLKLKKSYEDGRVVYKEDPNNPVESLSVPSLLIIDEASMINSYILGLIERLNTRVVFVGDEKQLNPVGEENSPVFHQGYPQFELTEILRHDNDIISLSRNLQWLDQRKSGTNFKWIDSSKLDLSELVESNGTDSAKFTTWTNKVVSQVNNSVRKAIYGEPNQIMQGETILMNEPFGMEYRNNEEVYVNTLVEDVFVSSIEEVEHKEVKVLYVNGVMPVVADSDKFKYEANLKKLRGLAKAKQISWAKYYNYMESFGKYQFNHALTVHRSQGSTFGNTFVNVSDIKRNWNKVEQRRMLYTAVTRSSDTVYLV